MSKSQNVRDVFKLSSSDSEVFSVKRDLLKYSKIINSIIVELELDADDEEMAPIHLDDVDGATLKKVLEWLNFHEKAGTLAVIPTCESDLVPWEKNHLISSIDDYLSLIMASRSLDIPKLIAATDIIFASMLNENTPEELMKKLLTV